MCPRITLQMWLNTSTDYKATLNRLKTGLPCGQVHLRLHNLRHASHPEWKAQIPEENKPNQAGEAGRLATQCQSVRIFLCCGASMVYDLWALSLCSLEEEDLQLPFTPGVRGCAPGSRKWQTTLSGCVFRVGERSWQGKGETPQAPATWEFDQALRTGGPQDRPSFPASSGPRGAKVGQGHLYPQRGWNSSFPAGDDADGSGADADIILGLSQIVLTFGNWFLKRVLTLRCICLHNTHI